MNWDAIGAVAEAIGAIAIIVTLIYLAVQVQNSVRATKAVVRQGVTDASVRLSLIAVEHPDFGQAVARFTQGKAEAEDKPRIDFYCSAWWRTQENIYYQYCNGLLDESEWEGHRESLGLVLNSDIPVWQHALGMYKGERIKVSKKFQNLVNELTSDDA